MLRARMIEEWRTAVTAGCNWPPGVGGGCSLGAACALQQLDGQMQAGLQMPQSLQRDGRQGPRASSSAWCACSHTLGFRTPAGVRAGLPRDIAQQLAAQVGRP